MLMKLHRRVQVWFRALFVVLVLSQSHQISYSSRKFLTGLIIGTLLARNGMPQGPVYSAGPHHYPGGHHQSGHQQPLLIIIPQGSGKKPYKPQVLHPSYGDYPHSLGDYPDQLARRRLTPIRRSPRLPQSTRMGKILASKQTLDERLRRRFNKQQEQQEQPLSRDGATLARSLAARRQQQQHPTTRPSPAARFLIGQHQLSATTSSSNNNNKSLAASLPESERYFMEER